MSKISQTTQSEARRTQILVSAAAVCVLITVLIKWSSAPAAIESQGQIDTPFYPEFEDPTLAQSLGVYAFDTENVEPLAFEVSRTGLNEKWTIPTHHNYPVDAEDRLAETAGSIIGITRGALATRWEKEHAKYGVVDPRQDSINVTDVEGVGKRIVIKGEKEDVLADYIIGNESPDKPGAYYVRIPGDDNVYICDVNIQLSTKFSDWISTDLLDVDSSGVVYLSVETYSFDEQGGQIAIEPGDELIFSKPNATENWATEVIDAETEEVDEVKIRSTINALASIRIAGVRQKNQGLTPELTFDEERIQTQSDFQRLQLDLLARGYALGQSDEDPEQLRLFSREGEIHVGSEDGIVYELYFGRAFTGEAGEIEFGGEDVDEPEAPEAAEATDAEDSSAETEDESVTEKGEETEGEKSGSPGRYLFVRARFDESFLGDKPIAPTAPVNPKGDNDETPDSPDDADSPAQPGKEAENASEDSNEDPEGCQGEEATKPAEVDDSSDDESSNVDSNDESENDPPAKDESEDSEATAESQEEENVEPAKTFEELQEEYEASLAEYEAAVRLYDERVREAQEKVDESNKRYALWYYVISGESFDALNLERDDLVKVKGEDAPTAPMAPGIPGLNIPGLPGN